MVRQLLGRFGRWLASFDPPRPAVTVMVVPEEQPLYWVGITRYEGPDPKAAEQEFMKLRDEAERIPGDVEWMNGASKVRAFRVV